MCEVKDILDLGSGEKISVWVITKGEMFLPMYTWIVLHSIANRIRYPFISDLDRN